MPAPRRSASSPRSHPTKAHTSRDSVSSSASVSLCAETTSRYHPVRTWRRHWSARVRPSSPVRSKPPTRALLPAAWRWSIFKRMKADGRRMAANRRCSVAPPQRDSLSVPSSALRPPSPRGRRLAGTPSTPQPKGGKFESLRSVVMALFAVALVTHSAFPQTNITPTPTPAIPPHDISGVDIVAADGAMATPLPVRQQRRLKKYDLPELTGSRQAVGSQLLDGHLPRPLVDYVESAGELRQRISFFEGGLVVIDLDAPWVASIHKRLIIPDDVLKKYLDAASPKALNAVDQGTLRLPAPSRRATVRIYDGGPPHFVERSFDPIMALPKSLSDVVTPLQDLMRAAVEDRQVTNTVANYIPK